MSYSNTSTAPVLNTLTTEYTLAISADATLLSVAGATSVVLSNLSPLALPVNAYITPSASDLDSGILIPANSSIHVHLDGTVARYLSSLGTVVLNITRIYE